MEISNARLTMRHIAGVLLCILGAVWSLESTCDDIDYDICRTFNDKVSVCDDTCLSKLCPRTCNKCPRKCYSCNDVSSLNDCNTTRICPDLTYDCLVHIGIASDFTIFYELGCAKKDVCLALFGAKSTTILTTYITTTRATTAEASTTTGAPILVGKKKRNRIFGECCSTDLCNRHEPVKRKRQNSIMTGTIADNPATDGTTVSATSPNACVDIDPASCQKLATFKRGMCNDDCVVEACPRTCGKCSECYSCPFVESPENCTSTSVCLPGEQCYVLEKFMDNGRHGYQIGCLHRNVCRKFHVNAGDIFGRRSDHVGLTLDGNCCKGDLCNHHAIVHTTKTTTHAPTHAQPTTLAPTVCYSCLFVESPENCTSTSVCLPGEQCYVLEKFMDSGEHVYQIGCLHENVCRGFHDNVGHLIGRRSDNMGLTFFGNCCNGNLCNHHAFVHTTTTTTHAPTHAQSTTPAPYGCKYSHHSHCPNGFTLVGGKCILVRLDLVTYIGAKDSCENHHCAKLMEHISDRDAENIRHYVSQNFPDVPPEGRDLLIGGHINSHHHVVWDSLGTNQDPHSDTCVVLRTDDHHDVHHNYMRSTPCDHHHFYICEAEFK